MQTNLQTTLVDIARLLSLHRIRYALIGGLAASLRGRTRATEDIDLVLACDVEKALGLAESLKDSGFEMLLPDSAAMVRSALLLPLVDVRSGIVIDLAIGMAGFDRMLIERAGDIMIGNEPIPVATAEDLVLMKAIANRPQDRQDIEGVLQANRVNFDWGYCEAIAKQLGEAVDLDLLGEIIQWKTETARKNLRDK